MKFIRRHYLSILALAAVIQTVIIVYNNSTGYIKVDSVVEFITRLLFGTLFSAPAALLIILIDDMAVRFFDDRLPWDNRFIIRIGLESITAASIGAVLGAMLTAAVHVIAPYRDGLTKNVVTNILITAVINLIIAASIEAVTAYNRSREAKAKADLLEREISRIKFETLKTQLNPHFMFNSLNVLSSLLRKDPQRAEQFIGEFANVYRYTLDVIEQPVVELSRELEFARSYLYLLQIRFSNSVVIDININSEHLLKFVPPLSIQTVIENAFKHNKVSEESPLHITIASVESSISVSNNLQPKQRKEESSGVGLSNLRKRYALLEEREPTFTMNADNFIVILPLITSQ